MGKFNIISKSPQGNKINKDYIIKYQVDNKPDIYELKMIYLELPDDNGNRECRYLFLDDGTRHYGVDNPTGERYNEKLSQEFIDELKKFQRGSSYRKTHPIAYTEKDQYLNQIKELQKRVSQIELQEHNQKVLRYKHEVVPKENNKEYNKIKKEIEKLISKENTRNYSLGISNVGGISNRVCIIDVKTGLPVSIVKDGEVTLLKDYQIDSLVRYTNKI